MSDSPARSVVEARHGSGNSVDLAAALAEVAASRSATTMTSWSAPFNVVVSPLLGFVARAQDPQVIVERRHELARSAGGKLQLVIADPATNPVHTGTP